MSTLTSTVVLLLLAFLWKTLPDYFVRSSTPVHGGFVHPDFQEVKQIFERNIQSEKEQGASFAVYHNGEILVDLWGGYADQEAKRQWTSETLTQAWSCTKGAVAVIIAMLVDRNLLNYTEYVHKYWPEFQQNGKAEITLAMLLSHQAGLVSLGREISLLEYRDNWEELEHLMVQAKPAWQPGTKYSYHAYTFGMFADAIVRKVDPKHRNISQFFKEEIAEPFGLDFHVGLPSELHYRVARGSFRPVWQIMSAAIIERPSRWKWLAEMLPGSIVHSSMNAFDISKDMNIMNDPELQSIGFPSAVGFGTAKSLAKLYDYLANNGSINGKKMLSAHQVIALSTPVTQNIPVILAPDNPYAMGTLIDTSVQGQITFGHRGYGGQNAFADPTNGIGVSYVTNFNGRHSETDDPRAYDLLMALYKSLQKYNNKGTQ